jgi:glycosyltransferase involved in cell wall biosynthesis
VAFLLAGSGDKSYENHLHTLIKEKHLERKLFLLGFLNNPKDFVSKVDIGILPSLCVEAGSLALLEFMRAGTTVVASNTGSQSEFVEHKKTGLLIQPTLENIFSSLNILLDDEKLRRQFGKNAQQAYNEKFSYEVFFEKVMVAYGK